MKKSLIIICTALVLMLAALEESGAQNQTTNNWHIGPRIGYSGYTGIIGLEAQRQHIAFTIGFPGSVGIKYYIEPEGDSVFLGGFLQHFDNDATNLVYSAKTAMTIGGLGGGYRWRWGNSWDLSLSIAGAYGEWEEKSGGSTRTIKFTGVLPGLTVGYRF